MDEGAHRRVRVVDDQSERAHSLGHVRPRERRREVLSLAGAVLRDLLSVGERVAGELHKQPPHLSLYSRHEIVTRPTAGRQRPFYRMPATGGTMKRQIEDLVVVV